MINIKFVVFSFLLLLNFWTELCSEDTVLPGNPLKYLYIDYYPEFYKNSFFYEKNINSKKLDDSLTNEVFSSINKLIHLTFKNKSIKNEKIHIYKINKVGKYNNTVNIIKHILYRNQLLDNNILHIEYYLSKNSKYKMMIIALTDDLINKCFYIKWSSLNVDDFQKPFNRNGLFSPNFMWGINKTTESITSNLDLTSIKKLFPDFEGIYYYENFKEIVIDYKYNIEKIDFYWNIEFNK